MSVSRRFVLIAAAAALGFSTPSIGAAAEAARETALRLRAMMRPRSSARAVGLAYLARYPEEADAALLTRRLLAGLGQEPETARLDDRALRRRVAARVSADFAEGRTASLDGWLLSRTEARLCALAALPPGTLRDG
jgi:hypothetical protein